ncbi:D-3-phosphoglycerate dehydrogenase [Clostridium homopropionicum DSM 5847]|uniref:D-3-phosphoglycerate dehydrogenase n=1 Tax=Clostridium homopropionicum DSM 5847 TaxID=1121318 RepID=A0A0L6Z5B7_9CLOT|nr:phosphoglycerate dehydrogenase [Clostridium homopropionicum]KOA18151.1 D-3-phosphoglycerate dehydrogenase [Clostridium homopropionicum DSM 5847]SFG95004.1 D-3-phosphoglycerate dehydrogenase [Clostridium homopropionicum]
MARGKVIVAERIDDAGINLLKEELEVDIRFDIPRNELLEIIDQYDGLIIRSDNKVDKELMAKATKLKIVGRAGNGVDNIDVEEATKRGIIVANTPDSNSISACELAITHMLVGSRKFNYADSYLKAGNWGREIFMGNEVYGKTLGIIGLGRIGGLVATRMKAFGVKLIAYDPYISDERFLRYGAEKKETLDDLIKEADIITIHTPRTKETIGIIGKREVELMKDGVRIVNAARGKLMDEAALYDGLKSGKIASVGLDVHDEEPRYSSALYEFNNVTVTPHIGATTFEAQEDVGITIAVQVINGIKGDIVPNAVNLPGINRDEFKEIKPYIELMENLGKLYYQLNHEPVKNVEIVYWGDLMKYDISILEVAFLKGLLQPISNERVNYINSKLLAENSGISIRQETMNEYYDNYSNLITIKITNNKNEHFTLSGAVSNKQEGKLVEMQGYEVDVKPSQYMLFIQNKDVPGVIGHVGTMIGQEDINVATMYVGRKAKGELALMILNVDSEVTKESLEKFKTIDNVIEAKTTII